MSAWSWRSSIGAQLLRSKIDSHLAEPRSPPAASSTMPCVRHVDAPRPRRACAVNRVVIHLPCDTAGSRLSQPSHRSLYQSGSATEVVDKKSAAEFARGIVERAADPPNLPPPRSIGCRQEKRGWGSVDRRTGGPTRARTAPDRARLEPIAYRVLTGSSPPSARTPIE